MTLRGLQSYPGSLAVLQWVFHLAGTDSQVASSGRRRSHEAKFLPAAFVTHQPCCSFTSTSKVKGESATHHAKDSFFVAVFLQTCHATFFPPVK
jgi:hypothetical protein